jgi:hypothetical protein
LIVRQDGDKLVVIPQVDHANLSGQFAARWGNVEFDRLEPSIGMEQSAYHHDDGWKGFDGNPPLDPGSKRPLDFYRLPVPYSLKIHEDTVERIKDLDIYAQLMISMHRSGLCHERYGTEKGWELRGAVKKEGLSPELRRFAEGQEAWQEEVEKRLQEDEKERSYAVKSHVWTNYKLLQVFDRLSLFVCQYKERGKVSPTPRRYRKDEDIELSLYRSSPMSLELDSWPFDVESFDVHLTTYLIENRDYTDSGEVARCLYSDPSSRKVLKIGVKNG